MIHSSYKSIGPVEGGPQAVLAALSDYFEPGLLVLPTHTWARVNTEQPVFEVENTPSNVGILGELLRQEPGVIRTLHPTHSLAVKGAGAAEFASGEEQAATPAPRSGCHGKIYDADSYVIFVGVPLTKNTIIHGAEEWAGIDNRLSAQPLPLVIRTADGTEIDRPMYSHWSALGDQISETYDKLLDPLLTRGIAWRGTLGDAELIIAKVPEMIDYTLDLLAKEPDVFLDYEPIKPVLA